MKTLLRLNFMLMVLLIVVGCVGWQRKDNESDGELLCEEATEMSSANSTNYSQKESERYRLWIKAQKDSQLAWRDSVMEVIGREHDVRYAYMQLLNRENKEYEDFGEWQPFIDIEYFLFDITQDGIPEMFVVAGEATCNYTLMVYTYRKGKAVRVLKTYAGNSRFHRNRAEHYVVQIEGKDHTYVCYKIMYKGGKFQIVEFFYVVNRYDSIQFATAVKKYKKEIESTSFDEDEVVMHEDSWPILQMFE